MDIKKLLSERSEYGETWALHGEVIKLILPEYTAFVQRRPRYQFPWEMILNKLIRALFSPDKLDHWKDIQGYAQLVINDLETKSKEQQ